MRIEDVSLDSLNDLKIDFKKICLKVNHNKEHTKLIRECLSEKIILNYEFNLKNIDFGLIKKIIKNFQKIPESIRVLGNNFGAKVLIFDEKMTDNECMYHLKNKVAVNFPRCILWEDISAAYSPSSKTILVKSNYSHNLCFRGGLHEYGHLVNDLLRELSNWKFKRLSRTTNFCKSFIKAKKSKKIKEHFALNPEEFFAESFSRYYFSAKSKKKLKGKFPEVYFFVKKLEDIIERDYSL